MQWSLRTLTVITRSRDCTYTDRYSNDDDLFVCMLTYGASHLRGLGNVTKTCEFHQTPVFGLEKFPCLIAEGGDFCPKETAYKGGFRCEIMAPTSPYSDTVSLSSSSSSSSSWHGDSIGTSAFFSRIADTVRDKVEAKKLEINATMQEKLPEWKMRGAMYGNLARETGIEWSRKGKEAVDRWKKELAERGNNNLAYGYMNLLVCLKETDSQGTRHDTLTVFGMPLKEAVALTKIDEDDKYPAVFRRCIEYLEAHGNDSSSVFLFCPS